MGAKPQTMPTSLSYVLAAGGLLFGMVSMPVFVYSTFEWPYSAVMNGEVLPAQFVPATIALFLLFGASWWVKNFLIQFVGDVAAYTSSFRLDRFFKLRKEIQDVAAAVGRTIYGLTVDDKPLYESVLIAGHSLGSVIAYDTLNRLLVEDKLGSLVALQVAKRTKLLLTFGSPLNKIAYLFTALSVAKDLSREQLASSLQPLIDDPAARQNLTWINVWTPNDIISGHLDFFDPVGGGGPNPVENYIDEDAHTPVAAHTEYWNNSEIYRRLTSFL